MKNFFSLFFCGVFTLVCWLVIFGHLGPGYPLHEGDLTAGQQYQISVANNEASFEAQLLMSEVKEHGAMTDRYYLIHKEGSETFVKGRYVCILEKGKKKLVLVKASADSQ